MSYVLSLCSWQINWSRKLKVGWSSKIMKVNFGRKYHFVFSGFWKKKKSIFQEDFQAISRLFAGFFAAWRNIIKNLLSSSSTPPARQSLQRIFLSCSMTISPALFFTLLKELPWPLLNRRCTLHTRDIINLVELPSATQIWKNLKCRIFWMKFVMIFGFWTFQTPRHEWLGPIVAQFSRFVKRVNLLAAKQKRAEKCILTKKKVISSVNPDDDKDSTRSSFLKCKKAEEWLLLWITINDEVCGFGFKVSLL